MFFKVNHTNVKSFWLKSILLSLFIVGISQFVFAQHQPSDTIIVYHNHAYYFAKIIGEKNKKVQVESYDANSNGTQYISKKHVFIPIVSVDSTIDQTVRFRYLDPLIAEEVMVKGTILGINGNYYLLKFINNGKKEVAIIHKAEIVRKDL